MTDSLGPGTLRALAKGLAPDAVPGALGALGAHADAWDSERAERAALALHLAEVQKKLEALEQDRKWWQDNAIRRRKRSEARRKGG